MYSIVQVSSVVPSLTPPLSLNPARHPHELLPICPESKQLPNLGTTDDISPGIRSQKPSPVPASIIASYLAPFIL